MKLKLIFSILALISFNLAVPVLAQTPSLNITSPSQNAEIPAGTVNINFEVQNFTLGNIGQSHLHFYIDDPDFPYSSSTEINQNAYMFYAPRDEDSGVLLRGEHTHAAHWQSPTSIGIFGLSPGIHKLDFILAESNHSENSSTHQQLTFNMQTPPPGEFKLITKLANLNIPVRMAYDPAGQRLYYNELTSGRVRVIDTSDPDNWQHLDTSSQPLYLVPDLDLGNERGLLGITLHPQFSSNNLLYLYHSTVDDNRVIRIIVNGNQAIFDQIILSGIPDSENHNAGSLAFGPDNKLYITVGDAETSSAAQDLNLLNGSVLRLNDDGTVPTDNPFYTTSTAARSKIWAYGLRNSFGSTFHPHTGHLWTTENGPSQHDEVNQIIKGGNYGWPVVTGIANNNQYIDPLLDSFYPNDPGNITTIAPTGIAVIPENSPIYPESYHNNLIFIDHNFGRVHRVILSGNQLNQLGSYTHALGNQGSLLDLIIGPGGYLYVSSFDSISQVALTNPPEPTPTPTLFNLRKILANWFVDNYPLDPISDSILNTLDFLKILVNI